MTDSTPYTIPAESRRWRALILAAALHAMLLGALWLGARGQSDAQVPLKAERAARTEAAASVKEMAKPEPERKEARIVKSDVAAEQQEKRREQNKLLEQKKHVENARAAELKRKENQRRLEKQKGLAEQRAKEKKVALANETRKKQEKQRSEALAKKNTAEAARKLAAEAGLRDKLRKEEMRRIAGGMAESGRGRQAHGVRGAAADG
jgi:colicin import membrane protein